MAYYEHPEEFNERLWRVGLVHKMYNALEENDMGKIVTEALEILKKTNELIVINKAAKNQLESEFLNLDGEKNRDKDEAFKSFNNSLLRAPNDSNAMAKAYVGRCKLLYNVFAFNECLQEIEKCLAQYPRFSKDLESMKSVCLTYKNVKGIKSNKFTKDFFNFDVERHPLIPCLSAAADIIIVEGLPKVVAVEEMDTGTVVAVEKAYVRQLNRHNTFLACYHCHKLSLNLIPCETCTSCLFCSKTCKEESWREYHNIECHIIFLYDKICPELEYDRYALSIRAAIKLKMSCTWDEFISLSSNMGLTGMKSRTVNEIYDVNNEVSILNFNDDLYFKAGCMFRGSFAIATVIHYLQNVPNFFPEDNTQKEVAVQALGAVMLNLFTCLPMLEITNAAKNFTHQQITSEPDENFGFFSFTGKLRHSCDANLMMVGLNDKVALIALRPIKPGEELGISYIGHWYESIYEEIRAARLFSISEIRCRCCVCEGGWDPRTNLRTANLSAPQKAAYKKWKSRFTLDSTDRAPAAFKETCNCLNVLSNRPHTEQHYRVFKGLKNLLILLQYEATGNATII